MLKTIKTFLLAEDGGAVEWLLTIIAGALIVAVAYTSLRGSPVDLGSAIQEVGGNAANEIRTMKEGGE